MGEIVTSIEIGHVSKNNIRLLVIQNLNVPAILGMDTLEKFGSFGIDWNHHTLTLGDAKLKLEKRSHGSVLSPHLRSCHPATFAVLCSGWYICYDQCDKDALFSPFMDKMARFNVLLGASVVTMGPQNRIPVTVMDNSEVPVAGTRNGELSPVKVEEQSPEVNTIPGGLPRPPTTLQKGPAAVDLNSCEVTASERQELKLLLDEYRDVFANDDSEIGRTHRAQFHIHTKTQVPVAVKLRRTPLLSILRSINKSRAWRSMTPSSPPPLLFLHLFFSCLKQMVHIDFAP